MIDDQRQDLAAEYALGSLNAAAARAFEAELASDPELRAFTDELRETAAQLAHTAPRHLPPPELRERIVSAIRAEAAAVATPAASAPATPVQSGGVSFLPWILAAGFAVTTATLWFERDQWRSDSLALRQEAIKLRDGAEKSKQRIAALNGEVENLRKDTTREDRIAALASELEALRKEAPKERLAALTAEVEMLRKEALELRSRDALAQIRIATLSTAVAAYRKGSAVVVWDEENQRGVVRLVNLPPPATGKDYQLWVIDPKYPKPVSGGVVPVKADGSARVVFKADQPIENADKFAISVEPAGGVPSATGPIVFLGN
jgi:anti-sigma-K factor RskA